MKVSLEQANSLAHMVQGSESPVQFYFESAYDVFTTMEDRGRAESWTAYLFPSGTDPRIDEVLTSHEFLKETIDVDHMDPGTFVVIGETFGQEVVLNNISPAIKKAFAEFTRWPGVLIFTPTGSAEFFELSKDLETMKIRLKWLFSNIKSNSSLPEIRLLNKVFSEELLMGASISSQLKIMHLSDLHFGSNSARRRMARVQELIKAAVQELGQNAPVVPVVTGDLLDSPTDENFGDLQVFLQFINDLGVGDPVIVLGNHDVREDGWLNPALGQAVNISRNPITWIEEHNVAIAAFNSVVGGRLARGYIGEDELMRVGNALDNSPEEMRDFVLVAALHHHPIPVPLPSWYRKKWYEVVLGRYYEATEELEDAETFLNWISKRQASLVLHGHKHIPRFDIYGDAAVVGCGSTTGNVDTAIHGQTYMSMNLITIDRREGQIGCRLLAEQIPGAGFQSVSVPTHEIAIKKCVNSVG